MDRFSEVHWSIIICPFYTYSTVVCYLMDTDYQSKTSSDLRKYNFLTLLKIRNYLFSAFMERLRKTPNVAHEAIYA